MLRDFLYEETTIWVFLIVTVVLGGGAAWMAGRAVATAWGRWWMVVVYCLLIGAAVRFIHFSLFAALLRNRYRGRADLRLCRVSRDPHPADGAPVRVCERWGVNIAGKISDNGAEWRLSSLNPRLSDQKG